MQNTKDIIKNDLQINALLHYLSHSVDLLITGYLVQTQMIERIEHLTEMLKKDHNYPVEEFIDISIILSGVHDESF